MPETSGSQSALEPLAWRCISSGIDWLSCSTPRTDGREPLYLAATELLLQEERSGNDVKAWKSHGLHGFIAGSTVRAVSDTHVFAQVSGAAAGPALRKLLPHAQNCSRLDLQVTARTPLARTLDLAGLAYAAQEARKAGGRPLSRTIVRTRAGGATCYLGSRRSDVFGRVYDKGVESGQALPGHVWRWEVELKRHAAAFTAFELLQLEEVELTAAATVREHMLSWGISSPALPDSAGVSYSAEARSTDRARSLAWLSNYVSPTVRRLLRGGPALEVYQALGLTPPTDS